MTKMRFFDDNIIQINEPDKCYSIIYAPNAKKITVKSASVIFCSQYAKVDAQCADVFRGNWCLANGCVLSKDNPQLRFDFAKRAMDLDTDFHMYKSHDVRLISIITRRSR